MQGLREADAQGRQAGAGSRALLAPGTAKVTVKLSAAGKRRLRRLAKASLKLSVTAEDAAGKRTRSRAVAVRR